MANPEHVRLVQQGAAAIRAWRGEIQSDSVLDLRAAKLRGISLAHADLELAKLDGADLEGSNLSDARLTNASLDGANLNNANLSRIALEYGTAKGTLLRKADLQSAYLPGTRFDNSDLSEANLQHAELPGSTFIFANLQGARLENAILRTVLFHGTRMAGACLAGALLGRTVINDVDFSTVNGLETCEHLQPSLIDVNTLFKSTGKIPKEFLRGCGVPEVLIEHLPSLIGAMQPIQFYSCFISYSSKDDEFARRLHSRLRDEKLNVWFAPEDMRGGRKSAEQIDEAIRNRDRLLLVLSEHSMESQWVRREVKRARRKEKETGRNVLFPLRLVPFSTLKAWDCLDSGSGEDLAEKVREYHIPDFSSWKDHDAFEAAFADLMRDLRREDDAGAMSPK